MIISPLPCVVESDRYALFSRSTIAYIANLHDHFHMSLSQAYSRGCEQFDHLRSVDEIATFAAENEARHNGARYKKNVFVSDVVPRSLLEPRMLRLTPEFPSSIVQ